MTNEFKPFTFGHLFPWLHEVKDELIDFSLFSERPANCLEGFGIRLWADLAKKTPDDLLVLPNFGKKSEAEVLAVLEKHEQANANCNDMDTTTFSSETTPPHFPVEVGRWANLILGARSMKDIFEPGNKFSHAPLEIQEPLLKFLDTAFKDFDQEHDYLLTTELLEAFIDALQAREQLILRGRVLQENSATLEELGKDLGVSRERVRQLFKKVESTANSLLEDPQFTTLRWITEYIKTQIYPFQYFPKGSTDLFDAVSEYLPKPLQNAKWPTRLLLWLTGLSPRLVNNWIVLEPRLFEKYLSVFNKAVGDRIIVGRQEVSFEFQRVGFAESEKLFEKFVSMFFKAGGWREMENGWFSLWGGSAIDKSAIVLEMRGEPLTPKEINDLINEDHSVTGIQNGLSSDERFTRTDKFQRYALSKWGYEEYSGIYLEICERIERGDGQASVAAIIEEFTAEFSVSEHSVSINLGNATFAVSGDTVRFSKSDTFDAVNPIIIKDAIETPKGWGQICTVGSKNLKGYSFHISNHIAFANGIRPGDSLMVTVDADPTWDKQASVIWRIQNTNPSTDVGRLRGLIERDFAVGQEIIIVPGLSEVNIFRRTDFEQGSVSSIQQSKSQGSERFTVRVVDE
jgi:hypothetical protein